MGAENLTALRNAAYALADMVFQFGYDTTFRGNPALCDAGLSALENAVYALKDCGCKVNSNWTISEKSLLDFMAAMKEE